MVFDNCMVDLTDAEEYQCGLLLEKYFLKHGKKQGLLSGHEKYKKRPAVALKDSQLFELLVILTLDSIDYKHFDSRKRTPPK